LKVPRNTVKRTFGNIGKDLPHFEEIVKIFGNIRKELSHFEEIVKIFGNIRKELPHFEEIVKIFGGFGQIFVVPQHVLGFLDILFFYLSDSQIWLNLLLANRYFWSKMRKLRKKTYFYVMFEKIFSKEKKGRMLPSSARCFWCLRIAKRL
jgi:hypothetical protein